MALKFITSMVSTMLFAFITTFAQTNTTPSEYYKWKGNKTEFQKGYVVLRSGKKIEGNISVRAGFSEITLQDPTGKEITFDAPAKSLTEFGLYVVIKEPEAPAVVYRPINESPKDLYKWGTGMTLMDHDIVKTKAAPGYVITKLGKRIEGQMVLKKVDGEIEEWRIETTSDKQEYAREKVKSYGLLLKIGDLTRGGSKIYKTTKMNFYPGYIVKTDGTKVEGQLAYMKLDEKAEDFYGVYFTANPEVPVTLYSNSDFKEAVQNIPEGLEEYNPEGEDYLGATVVEGVKNGYIMLANGTRQDGKIDMKNEPALWYAKKIVFTDDKGVQTTYDEKNALDYLVETVEGKEIKFIQYKGAFAQVINEGATFQYFRNPFPTTKNEFMSNIASMAGQETQKAIVKETVEQTAKAETKQNLKSGDDALSAGLKGAAAGAEKGNEAAQATQGLTDISLMKKEFIIFNKKTKQELMVHNDNFKDESEALLMGCMDYLSMDKKQQNELKKFKNVTMALDFLNKCY